MCDVHYVGQLNGHLSISRRHGWHKILRENLSACFQTNVTFSNEAIRTIKSIKSRSPPATKSCAWRSLNFIRVGLTGAWPISPKTTVFMFLCVLQCKTFTLIVRFTHLSEIHLFKWKHKPWNVKTKIMLNENLNLVKWKNKSWKGYMTLCKTWKH